MPIRLSKPAACDISFLLAIDNDTSAIRLPHCQPIDHIEESRLEQLQKRTRIIRRGSDRIGFVYGTRGWDEFALQPTVELKRLCFYGDDPPSACDAPSAQVIDDARMMFRGLAACAKSRLGFVQLRNDDLAARRITDALGAHDRPFTFFSAPLDLSLTRSCRERRQIDLPGPSVHVGEKLTVRRATCDDIPLLIALAQETDRCLPGCRLLRSRVVRRQYLRGEEVYRIGLQNLFEHDADSLGRYFVFCCAGKPVGKVRAYIDHDWPEGTANLMLRCFFLQEQFRHQGLLEKFIEGVVGLMARDDTVRLKTLAYGASRKAFDNLPQWTVDELGLFREIGMSLN